MTKSIRYKWNIFLGLCALLIAVVFPGSALADTWQLQAGAESPNRERQGLAFLPNEIWIHVGDSIRWTFPTHERHTVTFLKPGQTRPPAFGPTFGVLVGCPGVTPDESSFDGSTCVTSDVLLLDQNTLTPPTYSVTFPTAGNFKFVDVIHADMTGVVHVLNLSEPLPHGQDFYDRQAQRQQAQLLAEGSGMADQPGNVVAAGLGEVVATGAGSQTASLMRFVHQTIVVQVGDTVEWTSLDPSINHTVTFGVEPFDPRLPSANVTHALDGAREAVISSTSDSLTSGFLSPAPQDRANLAQSNPGVTRFRVTFTSAGTFNYICAVHDELGMRGRVIVRPKGMQ